MLSINPKDNSERENYKLLIGTIIPRPIAFVTTKSDKGIVNAAPFSFFNIVSSNPPMISVSVQRKGGQLKDTARNIYENHEFVVHIVDTENVDKINETAASLPPTESELELAKLTQVESEMVSVPGVKEAKVRFECKLVHATSLGGKEDQPGCDLFVGEIVRYHIDEMIYDGKYINPTELDAISRLAGNDYAKIGEIFTLERPK